MQSYVVEFGSEYNRKTFVEGAESPEQAFEAAFEKYLRQNPTDRAAIALSSSWGTVACRSEQLACHVAKVASDGFVGDVVIRDGLRSNPDLFARAMRIMRANGINIEKIEEGLKKQEQEAMDWEWSKP